MSEINNAVIEIDDVRLKNFIEITADEMDMVREWRNSEFVRQWMYQDHIISKDEHRAYFNKLKSDTSNIYYLLQHKNGEYIGVVGINKIDKNNRNAYFALYSNPNSKVVGIGRILDKTALEIAFKYLKLHSFRLEVIEDNYPVINLHKKYGFVEEGRLKQFVFKEGKWKDVLVMGIINHA